jgi:hypothetical protein
MVAIAIVYLQLQVVISSDVDEADDKDVDYLAKVAPADHKDDLVPTKDVSVKCHENLPTQISDPSSCSKEDLLMKVAELSEQGKQK